MKKAVPGIAGAILVLLAACGEVNTPTAAPVAGTTPTAVVAQATPQPAATSIPVTTAGTQTTAASTVSTALAAPITLTATAPAPTAVETTRSSAAQDALQAEAVINSYFAALNDRNYQTAFTLLSDHYRQQVSSQADFARTFSNSVASIKVNTMNQENVMGSGENWLVYKVQLQVKIGSSPGNFNDGNNIEWVKLVKSGQNWQVDEFATSPIDK